MIRGNSIPPMSDYAHWNEDAARVWYEENKYDMQHWDEPIERDPYEDHWIETEDISPDDCLSLYGHNMNTSGRTILFAGIEVYDQRVCDDCDTDLSSYWPRGSQQ